MTINSDNKINDSIIVWKNTKTRKFYIRCFDSLVQAYHTYEVKRADVLHAINNFSDDHMADIHFVDFGLKVILFVNTL